MNEKQEETIDIENEELKELFHELGSKWSNLTDFKKREDYIKRVYQGKKLLNQLKEKLTDSQKKLYRNFNIHCQDTIKVLINYNDFQKIKFYSGEKSHLSFPPSAENFRILGIEIMTTASNLERGKIKVILDTDELFKEEEE